MIEDAKARQASGVPVPPGAPPPDDDGPEEIYGECEGEEDEGDMTYDIPEEVLQEYQMATGQGKTAYESNFCVFFSSLTFVVSELKTRGFISMLDMAC